MVSIKFSGAISQPSNRSLPPFYGVKPKNRSLLIIPRRSLSSVEFWGTVQLKICVYVETGGYKYARRWFNKDLTSSRASDNPLESGRNNNVPLIRLSLWPASSPQFLLALALAKSEKSWNFLDRRRHRSYRTLCSSLPYKSISQGTSRASRLPDHWKPFRDGGRAMDQVLKMA